MQATYGNPRFKQASTIAVSHPRAIPEIAPRGRRAASQSIAICLRAVWAASLKPPHFWERWPVATMMRLWKSGVISDGSWNGRNNIGVSHVASRKVKISNCSRVRILFQVVNGDLESMIGELVVDDFGD